MQERKWSIKASKMEDKRKQDGGIEEIKMEDTSKRDKGNKTESQN